MLAMIRALQLPDTNLNILRPQWVLKRVGKREGPRLCEYENFSLPACGQENAIFSPLFTKPGSLFSPS